MMIPHNGNPYTEFGKPFFFFKLNFASVKLG